MPIAGRNRHASLGMSAGPSESGPGVMATDLDLTTCLRDEADSRESTTDNCITLQALSAERNHADCLAARGLAARATAAAMLARRQILRPNPDATDVLAELGSRLLRQLLHFLHQRSAFGVELRARLDGLKTVRRHCALSFAHMDLGIHVQKICWLQSDKVLSDVPNLGRRYL